MWPLTSSPAATLCKVTMQRRLAQGLAVSRLLLVLLLVCPVKETLQVWEFGKLCCALLCSKAELVGSLSTAENQHKIKPVD